MKNSKVQSLGGNQYNVTIGDETRLKDMDGIIALSNEDYTRLEEMDIIDDSMFAPMHSVGDEFFEEALHYMINYSGFDIEEYIADNK